MSEDQTRKLSADDKLDLLLARMTALEQSLAEFRAFAEPKLYDTKPIWEQALAEVLELKAQVTETNERLGNLERGVRMLDHKFENQLLDLANVRADVRDLRSRVEDSERPHQ